MALDTRQMAKEDVVEMYELFDRNGVHVWIDGGWGVDALLGEQTRPHADLDIAIQSKDLEKLRSLLSALGFVDQERDDTTPWNFVLGDSRGRDVDIHAIELDSEGNGVYGPPERGVMFPAGSLTGTGVIAGREVRCIEAKHLLDFHTGYDPDENDIHDVLALCHRFGLEIPVGIRHLFAANQEEDCGGLSR